MLHAGLADQVMRSVVRQMHECVEVLVEVGQVYELDLPVASLHILEFAERVACLTLEALRTWPDTAR